MPDALATLLPFLTGLSLGAAGVAVVLLRRERGLVRENAELSAQNQLLDQRIAEQQRDVTALEARFFHQFENLAHKIFDEKSKHMREQSADQLGVLLNPLREHLQTFQQKVEASEKEQFSLKNEIRAIMSLNENMRVQTEKLTNALKGDVKAQGGWGEVVLERILEASGLERGLTYTVQGTNMGLKHVEDGTRLQPDVIIHLPDAKNVIVDAKVSLQSYERLTAAGDDGERNAALAAFTASVKNHVKGLSERRYQDVPDLGTPDFVLMFMPIEGAYALAMQADAGLHSYAWENRIVIVGPSTLFSTLRTIASVWRLEQQNKNAQEIARQGGSLYDKFVGFVEDMDAIGNRINQTRAAYDAALTKLSKGAGNLVKKAQDLHALGINPKKSLPKNLGYDDDAEDDGKSKTARLS